MPRVSVKVNPLVEIWLLLRSVILPDPELDCSGAFMSAPERVCRLAEGLAVAARVYPEPSSAVTVIE
jgi:hypothetical protein